MKIKVLVDFHYARDGKNAKRLAAGDLADFLPEHVSALRTEGKVEGQSPQKPARRKRKSK